MTSGGLDAKTSSSEIFLDIISKTPLFVLDVRNEEDYEDWRIEGPSVSSVNVPYFDLLDGLQPLDGKLPDTGPVVVVCAKEGSSEYVAAQLREQGREDVSILRGGMREWSQYLHPVRVGDVAGGGALYQFVRSGKGCLSYMVVAGKDAVVVDAARRIDVYQEFAANLGVKIRHVIDTHLHADHISGGRDLAEATDADYWLPRADAANATYSYSPLQDNAQFTIGDAVRIVAVASPGHTSGSTSLIVDDTYLLSGDILFVQSIGRPDLAGKGGDWARDLYQTLYQTYRQFSSDLLVLPAHFANPSELDEQGRVMAQLGSLLKGNSALTIEEASEFYHLVTENLPKQPNAYQEIREVNLGQLVVTDEAEREEMEIGPNRCAVSDHQ
ncbi:MBL fold metallo-hydrolase [Alicyclobacillus curvatus]|jgi:glyoxylase-like metal-dependent hydrolase (beta-lactamase superfamily II)|nr:MBL fold metallo-hydrolase [Alicyclobacillus curvatus]